MSDETKISPTPVYVASERISGPAFPKMKKKKILLLLITGAYPYTVYVILVLVLRTDIPSDWFLRVCMIIEFRQTLKSAHRQDTVRRSGV